MTIKNLTAKGSLLAGAAAMAMMAASASAGTVVLNFSDLTGSGTLPSNYHGLTWDPSWNYFDFFESPYSAAPGGTERIYSPGSTMPFINFGQQVTFEGSWVAGYALGGFWQGYQTQNGQEVLIDQSAPIDNSGFGNTVGQFINLDWTGVDEVRWVESPAGYAAIDNITYATTGVPDSGSGLMLFGSSFGALALVRRRFARA